MYSGGSSVKLPIRVSEETKEPIYHQIEIQIKALIIGGQLTSESPLPSIRSLSTQLACSVITTRRAYQNLENDGFIKTIQGKGTYVRELEVQKIEETKQKIMFDVFQKTIEHARQIGCSNDEIRVIFEKSLEMRKYK